MPSEKRRKLDKEKRLKTRNNLLEAAIKVFISKGYHKANISDIVSTAKVGQGTFYRNFESKREIFEEILKKTIEELILGFSDGALNLNNMPLSFEEYKNASKEAFIKVIPLLKKNKNTMILFFRDAQTIDKDFEEDVYDILDAFADLAQTYLDHAIKKGFARKCDSRLVSQSIVGIAIYHLKNWLQDKHKDSDMENILIEVNDLIFLGMSSIINMN